MYVHSFQSRNKDNKITLSFCLNIFSDIVLHIIKISGFFFFNVVKFVKFDKFYF